jgi:hypothetical protein
VPARLLHHWRRIRDIQLLAGNLLKVLLDANNLDTEEGFDALIELLILLLPIFSLLTLSYFHFRPV